MGSRSHVEAALQQHRKGNESYVDVGTEILEIAKNACEIYISRNTHDQRRFLNFLLSNITLDGQNVSYTYKKPFRYIAEGVSLENWWAISDKLRTFLILKPQQVSSWFMWKC